MGACTSVNSYAAFLQQLPKEPCRKVRWVFDGQRFAEPGIVLRNISPESYLAGARFAIDRDRPRPGALRSGHHPVVNLVVFRKRRDAEKCALSRTVCRLDVNKDDVVID